MAGQLCCVLLGDMLFLYEVYRDMEIMGKWVPGLWLYIYRLIEVVCSC